MSLKRELLSRIRTRSTNKRSMSIDRKSTGSDQKYSYSSVIRSADFKISKELTILEHNKKAERKGSLSAVKSLINRESLNMNILIENEHKSTKGREKTNTFIERKGERIFPSSLVSDFNFAESSEPKPKSRFNQAEEVETVKVARNDSIFGEKAKDQEKRLKNISIFGNFESFRVFKMIVKSGEDLRQEQFATQLINQFYQIFKIEKVSCWLNPYEIMTIGDEVGVMEFVSNSVSIDGLKSSTNFASLSNFFESYFGAKESRRYKVAIKNFARSLAGYSLVCYFLAIKDRHNGNILVDDEGHIVHIDFGFMLSNAPGKGIRFENAPFKLTNDFVEVLGGVDSDMFMYFRKLLQEGFMACKKHFNKIFILINMMYSGHGSDLPCFIAEENALEQLQMRFFPRPDMNAPDYLEYVDYLLHQSCDNWRTNCYDRFQYWVQGIKY